MPYITRERLIAAQSATRQALRRGRELNRAFQENLRTLRDEFKINSSPPSLTGFPAFLERICGWVPLNPNDADRSKAIVSTYHVDDPRHQLTLATLTAEGKRQTTAPDYLHPIQLLFESVNIPPDTTLPTPNGFVNLYRQFLNPSRSTIAVSGRRGAGKTMALNFFLTTAHDLLAKQGILWLRTDVAKIWTLRADSIDIKSYTILHSIYIFLRYAHSDLNLQAFADGGVKFTENLEDLCRNKLIKPDVLDLWNRISIEYKNSVRHGGSKPVTDFLIAARRESFHLSNGALEILYKEARTFLMQAAKAAGRNFRVVLIFDGADNIRVGALRERYISYLEELIEIISSQSVNLGDKFVIVARPETFSDMSRMHPQMPVGMALPIDFVVAGGAVEEVLKQKNSVLSNPITYWKRVARYEMGNEIVDSSQSRSFEESAKFLTQALNSWGEDFSQATPHRENQIYSSLDLVFDGNYRSLLRNLVRAHHYAEQLKAKSTDIPIKRVLLEGSLLAGCSSMPSNLNDSIHGHWCPNLFEGASVSDKHWHGLGFVRLIQLLSNLPNGCTQSDAINFLTGHFGYDSIYLNACFQTAWEFALIRPHKVRAYEIEPSTARLRTEPTFITTEKGKHILKLAFGDCAVFYFMAISTPLDTGILKSLPVARDVLVHGHGRMRHFYRSAVITGTLLWRHVITAHSREMKQLKVGLSLNDCPIQSEWFELKYLDLWEEDIIRRVCWVGHQDLKDTVNAIEILASDRKEFES